MKTKLSTKNHNLGDESSHCRVEIGEILCDSTPREPIDRAAVMAEYRKTFKKLIAASPYN